MSFHNVTIKAVNASPEEYHAANGQRGTPEFRMSSSALRSFWGCPAKWVEPIIAADGTVSWREFAGSKSTAWGDLFDCLLLTPDQFPERYAVRPETYQSDIMQCPQCGSVSDSASCRKCKTERVAATIDKPWNSNSDTCSEWIDRQAEEGRTVISAAEHFRVRQAVDRFLRDEILAGFVESSQKQVWLEGEWREGGMVVPVKCLIDLVPELESPYHKAIADVKTTACARVIPWDRWCHAAGYEVQAAWNLDMFVAATNREITSFCFLLSENEPPWQVGRRMMSNDLLDPKNDMGDVASGRRQYRQMMADYCACLKSGRWPGFDDTDEAVQGWTVVKPNPYAEQARAFAPKFDFGPEQDEDEEQKNDGDIIP